MCQHFKAPAKQSHHANSTYTATFLGAACCMHLPTMLQRVATCWVLLARVWKWSNLSQQYQIRRNTVAKLMQHVGRNNVVICCVGMLWSFGWGLRGEKLTYKSVAEEISKPPFLAPELQWASKFTVCSIHISFKCFELCPYLVCHMTTIENV